MDNQKQLVILTEATAKVGYGHLTRCEAIYQAFKKIGMRVKLIVDGDDSIFNCLSSQTAVKLLPWLSNLSSCGTMLDSPNIIIVDSYQASAMVYRQLAKLTSMLVCMDDTWRLSYPLGVIIHPIVGSESLSNYNQTGHQILTGIEYQPLRSAFWNCAPAIANEKLTNILITFGGEDIRDLSGRILMLLMRDYPSLIKNVVIGPGYHQLADLQQKADANTQILQNLSALDMKGMMEQADLAISAGGQTLSELACVGAPTLAILVSDNQSQSCAFWHKTGFIRYTGKWNSKHLDQLVLRFIDHYQDQINRQITASCGQTIINGKSTMMLVKKLCNLYENHYSTSHS
ncbi:MAG: hypothetical protein COY81_00255 [Candidatus Pacebacteria bacterium CG_4_10_14_0_8_um_filter_43_12]|nr:MAG: hypothetical protein COY81_00255 [Candidatus Pacebacteria bacterium CG_4_10_14_0_8_um_filter_43_12]